MAAAGQQQLLCDFQDNFAEMRHNAAASRMLSHILATSSRIGFELSGTFRRNPMISAYSRFSAQVAACSIRLPRIGLDGSTQSVGEDAHSRSLPDRPQQSKEEPIKLYSDISLPMSDPCRPSP